ncbi:AHH domain-containing protein [Corallococcus terminator]
MPSWTVWCLLTLLVGCATSREVRLETGRGEPVVFTPAEDVPRPVVLEEDALVEALTTLASTTRAEAWPREAALRLLALEERGGTYQFDVRTRRFTPLEAGASLEEAPSAEDVELTRHYLSWCERTMREGDCLRLLESRRVAPDAVSTLARGLEGMGAGRVEGQGHDHHIATNKFWKDTRNGGPWSPRLQRIFDRAGMSLDDSENIVHVKGHRGPHPREYHSEVYERLLQATENCRSMLQCREALTRALQQMAQEVTRDGTKLNRWVTKAP